MDYTFSADNKIHTRYSHLVRCTPGQVLRVVDEIKNNTPSVETEATKFGTLRHDMFAEYSRQYKTTPECFNEAIGEPIHIEHVEKEFTNELAQGVIVHSRPDAVSISAETIVDYKTVVDGKNGWVNNVKQYDKSMQLPFYAYQLVHHGIKIKRCLYLCEIWSADRCEILGYTKIEKEINFMELAKAKRWADSRIAMLVSMYVKENLGL